MQAPCAKARTALSSDRRPLHCALFAIHHDAHKGGAGGAKLVPVGPNFEPAQLLMRLLATCSRAALAHHDGGDSGSGPRFVQMGWARLSGTGTQAGTPEVARKAGPASPPSPSPRGCQVLARLLGPMMPNGHL